MCGRDPSVEKRSAFQMQFHLIVVSIFLKTCVKDHKDIFRPMARKKRICLISICLEVLLLAVL